MPVDHNIDYYPNNVQCADGEVLKYNSAVPGWECDTDDNTAGTGDITDVIAGTGMTGGATSGAATLNIDVGVGANQIVQLDGSGSLPAVDGSAVTNLDPSNLSAAVPISLGGTGATTNTGAQTALGLGTSAVADIGTAAGEVMGADGVPNCLSTEKLQMSVGPTFAWTCVADVNSGSTTFIALTDSPADFTGDALKVARVNAGETALEFFTLLDTDVSLGTSDAVAPTQNAVKTYIDAAITAGGADDLGDHTATQNIILGAHFINGDTDNEGLTMGTTGKATLSGSTGGTYEGLTIANGSSGIGTKSAIILKNSSTDGAEIASITGASSGERSLSFSVRGSGTVTERLRIANTGNIGIGSIAPTVKLDVNGDIRAMAQGDLRFGDSDSSNFVAFQAPTTVASDITWTLPATDGTNGQLLSTNGSGVLAWATGGGGSDDLGDHTATTDIILSDNKITNDGTGGITLNDDGDMLVGGGSPIAEAEITIADSFPTLNIKDSNDANSGNGFSGLIQFTDSGNNSTGEIGFESGPNDLYIKNKINSDIHFFTNNLSRMTVENTGNIGIGTSDPGVRLDVAGDILVRAQADLRFGDFDSSNFVAFQAPTTVASNVTWTLPATDGTNGQILSTNGSGTLAWATGAAGADDLGDHTATTNITLGTHYLSGDGGNEGIAIDADGDVGIGTTSAAGKLYVYTTGADGIVLGEDQGNLTSSGRLFFLGSNGNIAIMNENNNLSFRSGAVVGSSSGTSRMYLNGASGNLKVGPGTANEKLEVDGNIKAMAEGEIRLADNNSSNFVAFKAPATVASDVTWTLPATDGTNGQMLSTNGSGVLAWATAGGGADHLGNHTATQNINLATHKLV
jgi:trimeric autotransporter adhesin